MDCYKSFDVFDTCLVRLCGTPNRIFDIMAERLFGGAQVHLKKAFLAERERIERVVFKQKPNATISQLYDRFDVKSFGLCHQQLVELEMLIQEEQLYPNARMLELVENARQTGCKIAFISDMYLPSSLIRRVLEKYGFFKAGDLLAVSCEWNASKYDGALFEKVLKQTRTLPKQWTHYGDSPWSDYTMPQKKGMNACKYGEGGFSRDELLWLNEATYSASKLEIERFCGICRAVRLSMPDDIEHAMAVDFVASVYVPYVYHVLSNAQKRNFKRLYFIGRDGRIFLKIAEQFQVKFSDIELRYIKFSRRAIYPCSFYDVRYDELEWFFQYSKGQKLSSALSYIGMEWHEMSLVWRQKFSEQLILSDANVHDVVNAFIQNDSFMLLQKSAKKRDIFLKYLHQEGVFDDVEKAFVDLGWVGSTRVCINKILNSEGCSPVFVYYFGAASTYSVGNIFDDANIFQRQYFVLSNMSILLLEHYASMNEDGTVLAYEKDGGVVIPVEAKPLFKHNKLVKINEDAVTAVAKLYVDLNLCEIKNYDIFLGCGLRKLNEIEYLPRLPEYELISRFQSEDYGVVEKFVKGYTIKDVIALLIWGVPTKVFWDAGARIKTFGRFHNTFKKIFEITSSLSVCIWFRNWWELRK